MKSENKKKQKNDQTKINIRIDRETKEKAQAVLHELGLDLSSGIKVFLKQVAIRQKIPLELFTENGFTRKQESHAQDIHNETKKLLKEGKLSKFDTVEELFNDALNN